MRLTTFVTGVLVAFPIVASAEVTRDDPGPPRTPDYFEFIASQPTDTDIVFVRQLLPPNDNVAAVAQSKIIYLNHTGVTLRPGDNDSRTNYSSIVHSQVAIPAWNTSAEHWAQTVACMKDMFLRFDVTVTDVDPGNVPHIEAVFGGSPGNLGLPGGVGGVSPFTSDCGIIENSIVFTFTSVFPDNPQLICEIMSQEVAHSYGLDHEMLASDPMTYLNYSGKRSFKDQTVACGEYSNRSCGLGGLSCRPNQNSVQLLTQRLGMGDLIAPELLITKPADGAVVPPGFPVEATASDNVMVTMGTLAVDGQAVGSVPGAGPYSFATDAALPEGPHTIAVQATDGRNVRDVMITVTVSKHAGSGGSGDGDGDGDDDAHGGCAAGHDLGLGLLLLAPLLRRRRR